MFEDIEIAGVRTNNILFIVGDILAVAFIFYQHMIPIVRPGLLPALLEILLLKYPQARGPILPREFPTQLLEDVLPHDKFFRGLHNACHS